jgi:hypothetical protein
MTLIWKNRKSYERIINLERATKKMHLQINQDKTKYTQVTKKDCTNGPAHVEIGTCEFEVVHRFTCLGSEVNCKSDISDEIRKHRQIDVSMALGKT